MLSDGELLRRYTDEGREDAFRELVGRHIDGVYRAALRRVGGNAHAADDVVQGVFMDLAKKARSLRGRPNLAGWLYTGTRFAAAGVVRTEQRRRVHEQEAHAVQELNTPDPTPSPAMDPLLAEVLDTLGEQDREAVVMHYFEGWTFVEVGNALALSADAARMRVNRALDRLRGELARRGVVSTAAALGTALSAQGGISAPASLAGLVAGRALSAATAAAPAATTAWVLAGVIGVAAAGLTLYFKAAPPAPAAQSVPQAPIASTPAEMDPDDFGISLLPDPSETAPRPQGTPDPGVGGVSILVPNIDFATLGNPEKDLLKQLAALEQLASTSVSFWVRPGAARYAPFSSGAGELVSRGLVGWAEENRVRLSPEGRRYVAAHRAELDAHPSFYPLPGEKGMARDPAGVAFESLSVLEKNLLKRLVTLEQEKGWTPGETAYGFIIPGVHAGRDRLVQKGWVVVGQQKGVVHLTSAGRRFALLNAEALQAYRLVPVQAPAG